MNQRGSTAAISNRTGAKAAPGGEAGDQYYFDRWTTDNGLPQNSVSSILQTRDGFLWLATNDGLVRYDGVHFTIFNSSNTDGLKSSRFGQLFEDPDGHLWIIAEDGRLTRYSEGLYTTYTTADGLPHNRVLHMMQDVGGALILETAGGLAWWREGKFIQEDPTPNRPYSGVGWPAQSGAAWQFDHAGLHRVEDEHGLVTAHVPASGLARSDIKSLYEDGKGELWLGIAGGTLMRFNDGNLTTYGKKEGLSTARINCILEDKQGNIWLGLSDGLVRFKDGRFVHYGTADGLAGDHVLSLYEDREGILWIGTATGLSRLRDHVITSYSTDNGLSADNTYPIFQDRAGTVWIGSWMGLTRYRNGEFNRCGEQYGVAKELVTALMEDRDGGLWIGSYGGGARRWKDGKTTLYGMKDGLPSNVVRAICQDRRGDIWFGTPEGLARYKDGAFSTYTTRDGLPANAVNVIVEDSRDNLWIGTQLGLCRYRDGHFDSYSQEGSLSEHIVRAIYEDGDGAIWIGTYDNGLTRMKDQRFSTFTVKEGLFNNGVFQVLEDAGGNFWISCNLGIYRVSKKELNDYAEGRARSITSIPYGKRDGMLNSECNGGSQPAGIRARDGKLWFPTQGGVAVVDPQALSVSTQPPPVVIEEFLLDNKPIAFQPAVEIKPGIENFEIHYTGLSFIMSERMRFKYKLEGLDTEWVDAGTRRVAYYSHVPPGRYTFKVLAANRDGVWNTEGAAVGVRVIPPFWKTWWFVSIVLVGIAGAALIVYKLRIAQLERARAAQEAFSEQLISSQEAERQRIAAELHDGLGQQLLVIKNSALLGLGALGQQDRGKDQLSEISSSASQAIDEVREISYNLRPYQLDDLGLTKAIEYIIAKVAASSEIKFSSELDRIDGMFPPEAEINIYRIVQESLNNIVKHSGASGAKIVIEREDQSVDITIRDNGRGFDPARNVVAGRRGGFGLKGISERARMLGAQVVVDSAAGRGTVVTLKLETQNGRVHKG